MDPPLVALAVPLLVAVISAVHASSLPIRQYTTADGLPFDSVSRIKSDTRGFLWLITGGGLSRFDGNDFVNYGTADGLPRNPSDIIENPDGTYWVALWWNGIAHFDPAATDRSRLFTTFVIGGDSDMRVQTLALGDGGELWVGTTRGLFVVEDVTRPESSRLVELDGAAGMPSAARVWDLIEDSRGHLWVATATGLAMRTSGGRIGRHPLVPEGNAGEVYDVMQDDAGRIWAGHDRGVTVFLPQVESITKTGVTGDVRFVRRPGDALEEHLDSFLQAPGDTAWFSAADGIGEGLFSALHQSSNGRFWLAPMVGGLTEFDGGQFRHHAPGENIAAFMPRTLAEDPAGNLWIGSLDRGAMRLAPTGVVAYDEKDGLEFSSNAHILEDSGGEILVVAGAALYRFDGERFHTIRPSFLTGHTTGRSSQNATVVQDRAGDWWFGTHHGLYRFRGRVRADLLERHPADDVYDSSSGLPVDGVSALFEDEGGDLWIGVQQDGSIVRRDGATGEFHRFTEQEGFPASRASSFAQDAAGDLWVGMGRGLARFRDGRFDDFSDEIDERVPSLLVDGKGRLWVMTEYDGVFRVDEPTLARPAFRHLTSDEGLASDRARCAVEDAWGRIYLGSAAGVDRLDPETGHIRRYTSTHGLSSSQIMMGMRDRRGALWFTSRRGVSRIVPQPDSATPLPPLDARITGVRVAGSPYPMSDLGESELAGLRIHRGQNRVEVAFASISYGLDDVVRYQYRLAGAGDAWSEPAAHRSVNYANLAPGDYRFMVRAVNADGMPGRHASVGFRVLRPVWQQWWFVTLMAAALVAAGYGAHRMRLARAVELERLRTRIATDLHDDVGSSLSRIAILSEVARRGRATDPSTAEPLSRIADLSRELVDSMSDIVWAINPRRDQASDLSHRMRRFAGDSLATGGAELSFRAEGEERSIRLDAEVKRQVFLIFKESIHNAARHSGCSEVDVTFAVDTGHLRLEVRDDGRGFAPGQAQDGNGLSSMRRRAGQLGGRLEVDSAPGAGTRVTLQVPLGRRRGARSGQVPT